MKKQYLLSLLIIAAFPGYTQQSEMQPVILHWLQDSIVTENTGASWGVPWPQGKIKKEQAFQLKTVDGKELPLQSWPLAYWPDGTLKWMGFSTVAGPGQGPFSLMLMQTKKQKKESSSQVKQTSESIEVNTGRLQCYLSKKGHHLFDSLKIDGKVIANAARLVCILQHGPDNDLLVSSSKENFTGRITSVNVEQNGPVRTVIHLQGLFQAGHSNREWLPFHVRLYFYQGSETIRLVHTIIYDGDQEEDFIKGLGVTVSVPMREEFHNRHVRFSGEANGMWAEPVRLLTGRRVISVDGKNVYPEQLEGKRIPNIDAFAPREQTLMNHLPVWNDFRLHQANADGFIIQKRTNNQSAWINSGMGTRASGLVFAGDVNGGLAIGVKDFWQSYPAALEVNNSSQNTAQLNAWLWSPYGEAMDMRHYDTLAYGHDLEATYEDVQPGFSTATGVARTHELMLFACAGVPSREVLSRQAALANNPPLLVCSPEYFHAVKAFGVWSLPDRSTAGKRWIEDQLTRAIDFYKLEIEQRHWYGFWDYGDVMHAYDRDRHTWRYDIGGFAWANSELAPDMWLWYSFLRTGRADVFRMAEAMTRHTGEVDVYHAGRFEGLGSRHNVRHWGCGAKEVRISQAAYRRFYYYLTTDERTGDLMGEVTVKADSAIARIDPMRMILKPSQYPTHARVGPDWLALAGNWMTEWERTGDSKWRDKIVRGVNSFAKMPYGLFTSKGVYGYDPTDNKMYVIDDDNPGVVHLTTIMGGAEVMFELSAFLNSAECTKLWMEYCTLYGASKEEIRSALGVDASLGDAGTHYARLPAYAAYIKKDPELAARAWRQFLTTRNLGSGAFDPSPVAGSEVLDPIHEIPWISTNNTAQWCLNAIQLLELVGDSMPEKHVLWGE